MSKRDDQADAALVAANPWIGGAGRKEIKKRLHVGSARADRLRQLAWAGQKKPRPSRIHGRPPILGGGARVQQPPRQAINLPETRKDHFERPHILVVGDAHFEPDNSPERATWLGRFIADNLGPDDHVVIIGDWHGLTSLCSHSGAKEREGHRLAADIESGNHAIRLMYAEIPHDCRPAFHVTLGNHEHRLARLAEERPEYDGIAGFDLLEWETYGATVLPYLTPLRLHGWRFQHCLMNAGGRRPVSGVNVARNLLKRLANSESIVCGHNHRLKRDDVCSELGGRKWGLTVGCYFDHMEAYARDSNHEWWAGLVLLEHAHDGDAGIREIPLSHLRAMYGED